MSPEAERWLREPFPIGRIGDSPGGAAGRSNWHIVRYFDQGVEAVAASGETYIITETNAGPRAQRTT